METRVVFVPFCAVSFQYLSFREEPSGIRAAELIWSERETAPKNHIHLCIFSRETLLENDLDWHLCNLYFVTCNFSLTHDDLIKESKSFPSFSGFSSCSVNGLTFILKIYLGQLFSIPPQ